MMYNKQIFANVICDYFHIYFSTDEEYVVRIFF